jgi:L-amino acid N-acyltransferase YncA
MSIRIRPVLIDDTNDIFTWRNDPLTRAMSINSNEVSRQNHDQWFKDSLNKPSRVMVVGDHDDNKVGICRFDINEDQTATVSINLNPRMRGKGLSITFLQQSIDQFLQGAQCDILATIKCDNITSMKCFEHVGFIKNRSDDIFHYYTLKYEDGAP